MNATTTTTTTTAETTATETTATETTITAKLRRTAEAVPAADEFILTQGRAKEGQKHAPTHVFSDNFDAAIITPKLPADMPAPVASAMRKLWRQAILLKLADDAKTLMTGQCVIVTLSEAGMASIINDRGETRTILSAALSLTYVGSDTFKALASVYDWTATQSTYVATTLVKLAAPSFNMPAAQALSLLDRLAQFPNLLTGAAGDQELRGIHALIIHRLLRIVAAADVAVVI